jgi:hypothetical protein
LAKSCRGDEKKPGAAHEERNNMLFH